MALEVMGDHGSTWSQACREENGGGKPPREINKEKQEVCCRIMKCPRKEILEHRARENMR